MTNECILIICATEIEAKAINSVFTSEDEFNRDVSGEVTYYNLGNMGDVDIKLVLSEQGSVTPDGSLSTLSIAIPELNPKAIILCGYGFGLKPKEKNLGDQEICDIMISEKIVNYEPQKININSGEIPRGDRVAASPILKDHFRSASLDWKTPHIHFGLILTGEKLVNDPEFLSFLLSHEPEAIGGEMEAAGLYSACRKFHKEWIVIKAICDWGDGSKTNDYQKIAAENAANFVKFTINKYCWSSKKKAL